MPRPDAVATVAASSPATSAWANDVADGINAILDDIYGAAVGSLLAIPWTALTGVPTTFPPADHAADHAAGGGDALAPSAIGAWAKASAGGGAVGVTIHVGTTAPASPAEGDVWIKG